MWAQQKLDFLKHEGIVVDYVDPSNLVWSATDDPYFNDLYYAGEVKIVHINELQKQFPHLDSEELKEIQQQGVQQTQNFNSVSNSANEVDSNSVQLLYFEYKTVCRGCV